MKNLIFGLILFVPLIGTSQKLAEISFSNEDNAIGLNYIDTGNNFVIGAEKGIYEYDRAKIEHQKYKIGYSTMFENILNGDNNLITTASICYNEYKVIYNLDQVKRMPKISFQLGFRSDFTDRIWIGANWDIVQCTGGFNIAFLIKQ